MTNTTSFLLRHGAAALLLLAAAASPAWAEKADRQQPMTIAADEQSTIDLLKQVVVFKGNVQINQGTIAIRADRVEVRQTPEGLYLATATGGPGGNATFRQKRDGLDEFIEGRADRVEYDGRSDQVHFIGHAVVRRLRGATPADEVTGDRITYDNVAERFSVQGGASNVTAVNPSGRVRAVLTPRAASGPAPEPREPAAPLKPASGIGERR
jgi:lipopolysaccharide export system protein LptA